MGGRCGDYDDDDDDDDVVHHDSSLFKLYLLASECNNSGNLFELIHFQLVRRIQPTIQLNPI